MEPLHRISLIPSLPPAHFSIAKKAARYSHITGFILAAFFFGIGFVEGVWSFSTHAYALVQNVVYGDPILYTASATSTSERKGSDERVQILPVSEYNIKNNIQYINADAYIVGDVETGEIIISKGVDTVYPIASVSKLVTALVAQEHFTAREEVVVTKSALSTYGASGGLTLGEKVRALDLLYPLLLESSNDVALLISEQFDDKKFPQLMNEKVQDLGMSDTSFEEASGLSPKNISTANDLFKLSQYLFTEEPHVLDIGRIREFSLMKHTWNNYNHFLKYDTFLGGKNGYTDEALRTAVALFELPISKATTTEKRNIAIIVLHTDTREQDVVRILDFLKKSVSLSE